MKIIGCIAFILVIIGGLNWGLVGVWNFDLVAYLLGAGSTWAKVVYDLVGLAALYTVIFGCRKMCASCCGNNNQ
ncbi:DUF378 domain-containing protein [Patescibacteria group bacterium]|nr:DUF378 domain-containing protein [Patescibacteria group bacterium]MBU4142617.1 DUF378 domain-containing protein [Patescibacteria group bacterium]